MHGFLATPPVVDCFLLKVIVDPGKFGYAHTENNGDDTPKDEADVAGWMRFWHTASSNKPG
jgi:hypothetical protein